MALVRAPHLAELPCEMVQADLLDLIQVRRVLERAEPQTVFHLAAQSQARAARANPVSTLETNVQGTWNLLEACRTANRPQVVLSSSAKVDGCDESKAYSDLYAVSKRCAELIAITYAADHTVPVAIARTVNVFGGGDLNFSRIVPGAIRSTYLGERFCVEGNGRAALNLLHVDDAVSAFLALAEGLALRTFESGTIIHIGRQETTAVLEVVQQVLRIMERVDLEPRVLERLQHDTPAQSSRRAKACDLPHWQPKVGLTDGLVRTVQWYCEYFQRRAQSGRHPNPAHREMFSEESI